MGYRFFATGVVVERNPQLPKLALALRPPPRLARGLHRGQQQRHQHADDGDHHQKLDEGEGRRWKRPRLQGLIAANWSIDTPVPPAFHSSPANWNASSPVFRVRA